VRYADGQVRRVPLPVETWIQSGKVQLKLAGGAAIVSATVDPDHQLPDRDRSNNQFVVGAAAR